MEAAERLICPVCKSARLVARDDALVCDREACASRFPIIDGCPILINESNSVFAIEDYESRRVTTMDLGAADNLSVAQRVKRAISRLTPPASRSVTDYPWTAALNDVRSRLGRPPRVLVIGAGDAELSGSSGDELIYSDVAIGQLTQVVLDAHDIPFPDGYFDLIIAVAVLEHVADPYRCSDEIYRILKPDGFVYAVTPFMQQVHMGRYDFTRFTHLGHRRLFRRFTEQRSGVANAQGMVVAWSIERFFAGFSQRQGLHNQLRTLSRFIAFPFLAFDRYLARKPAAYDSASAFYFFGKKSETTLSDRELIREYRGMN